MNSYSLKKTFLEASSLQIIGHHKHLHICWLGPLLQESKESIHVDTSKSLLQSVS